MIENLEGFLRAAKLHLAANPTAAVTLKGGTAEDALRHASYLQNNGIIAVAVKMSAELGDQSILDQFSVVVARTYKDKDDVLREMEERLGDPPGSYKCKVTVLAN